MRLIYIANARLPTEKAHGVQIVKMCEAFADLGHQVELIIPRRIQSDPQLKKTSIHDYYRVKKNFTIEKIPAIDLLPLERVWKGFGPFAFAMLEISFAFIASVVALARKKDLIYTRSKLTTVFAAILHQPTIFEAHESAKEAQFDKLVAQQAKRIVAITKPIQHSWKAIGAKTIYAPDAVSEEFFTRLSITKARREVNLPSDATIMGYVGNLHTMGKEKGIQTLLEALKLLRRGHPSVSLCIVGGPQDLVERYQRHSRKMKVNKWVRFTGHVPFSLVPTYLQAMDILTMPFPNEPHFASDASPLKLFEYMASGKPIVASDLPGTREIIDQETAVLVKPDSGSELAKGIQSLIENTQFSQKLARNAQKKVKQYTWLKRAKRILEII